ITPCGICQYNEAPPWPPPPPPRRTPNAVTAESFLSLRRRARCQGACRETFLAYFTAAGSLPCGITLLEQQQGRLPCHSPRRPPALSSSKTVAPPSCAAPRCRCPTASTPGRSSNASANTASASAAAVTPCGPPP